MVCAGSFVGWGTDICHVGLNLFMEQLGGNDFTLELLSLFLLTTKPPYIEGFNAPHFLQFLLC